VRFASAAIFWGLAASGLGAQSVEPIRHPPWTFINAVGYGVLGFGVGLGVGVAASPNSIGWNDTAMGSILLFTAAGATAGGVIGRRASRHLDQGQPLTRGHRSAVVVGSVLFGGAVGSLAAIPLIAGEEDDTPLGSDAEAYAICTLGGMAVTAILMATKCNNIPVRGLRLVPSIRLR
jgi:hypothetical protein